MSENVFETRATMHALENRTIIITGASRGIGKAVSNELARAGVNLVLNARHNSPLASVADECEHSGVSVHYVIGDAAESGVASKCIDAALRIGKFNGFIHAAGVLSPGPHLWELTEDKFQEVMDASVTAGYQMISAALPPLRKQGNGLAVFLGSGAAEINTAGIGAYCIAKAAEEHLARQLAVEAPEITTLIYRPGVVETRMQRQAREAEGGSADVVREKFWGFKDKGELITPEQTAKALVNILTRNPRRFHGKVATWRDG